MTKINRQRVHDDLAELADRTHDSADRRLLRRAAKAVLQPPEIMNGHMVAKELGVEDSNLKKVVGLPEPFTTLEPRGRLWLADELRTFAAKRRRAQEKANTQRKEQ